MFSSGARKLFAVPSNVGPRTMPNYDALAAQGIYDLGSGVKVFAGTVDDPFYIDLGATFDTLNYRTAAFGTGIPAVLTDAQDADDTHNFSPDSVSGFNVNSIAIELPIAMLTRDGAVHAAGDPLAVIGTYATTSRPRIKTQPSQPGGLPSLSTNFVQIQRMGNALINEVIIGTGDKDKFSMSEPKNDSQFAELRSRSAAGARDQRRLRRRGADSDAAAHRPVPAGAVPGADLPRLQRRAGGPGRRPAAAQHRHPAHRRGELRKRLGFIAGDSAGYPNGRRVSDDVTDISIRRGRRPAEGRALQRLSQQPARRRREHERQGVPGNLPLRGLRPERARQPPRRSGRARLRRADRRVPGSQLPAVTALPRGAALAPASFGRRAAAPRCGRGVGCFGRTAWRRVGLHLVVVLALESLVRCWPTTCGSSRRPSGPSLGRSSARSCASASISSASRCRATPR